MAMNVKWKYEPYAFYNKKGIEERLAEMAEQGWFIEKMDFFWKYCKGEPAKRTYNVVYMEDPDGDVTEARQREFVDYCEAAGWERCFAKKCMLIFFHEGENPIPIETECEFAVKNIHKAMKSVYLQRYLSVILLAVMYIVQLWMEWKITPFNLLSANYTLFFAAYILMGLLLLLDGVVYYWWRRKTLQQISDDDELPTAENRIQRIIVDWSPIMVILVCIGVLLLDNAYGSAAIIGAIFVLFYIIYKFDERKRNNVFHDVVKIEKKKRAKINIKQPWGFLLFIAISLVVALVVVCITILSSASEKEDNMEFMELSPVTYEDLYVVEADETSSGSYYESESFLIKDVYFDQWIDSPIGQGYTLEKYFGYRYVEVKLDRMYDFAFEKYCEQENINLNEFTVVEQKFDTKQKIYQKDDRCVILWDGAFAEIYFDGVPTDEQVKIVAEKLGEIE